MKKKIAVIGGGISGITAAYYASKEADVTLFESSSSLGGHAHAEWITDSAGNSSWVDTAFLIFNEHVSGFLTAARRSRASEFCDLG